MKDWIMELCPEIVEWQAELIAEQAQTKVAAEREACAQIAARWDDDVPTRIKPSDAIRARGEV